MPAEARDGRRKRGNPWGAGERAGSSPAASAFHKRTEAHVALPPTPIRLSLGLLVHDDKTDMFVYFIIRALECL